MIWRRARVTFGVVCSPFLLNATVKHHIENEEFKAILMKGGFNLRKLVCRAASRADKDSPTGSKEFWDNVGMLIKMSLLRI